MTELAELRAENAWLRGLLGLDRRAENASSVARWSPSLFNEQHASAEVADALLVDGASPRPAKVALFSSLFIGRDDVHALRWDNTRTGKAGWGPAVRGGWANGGDPTASTCR